MFIEWILVAYVFVQGGNAIKPLRKVEFFKTKRECQIALKYEHDALMKHMKINLKDIYDYSYQCHKLTIDVDVKNK
jgi:hypothetical protein